MVSKAMNHALRAAKTLSLLLLILLNTLPTIAHLQSQTTGSLDLSLNSTITALAWNSNGDKLAVGTENGKLYVYTSTGKLLATQEYPDANITSVSWRPGTDTLAIALYYPQGTRSNRYLLAGLNGTVLWESPTYHDIPTILSWSPSGERLAVAIHPRKLVVTDQNGVEQWRVYNPIIGVDWNPSGDKLAIFTDLLSVKVYTRDGELVWEGPNNAVPGTPATIGNSTEENTPPLNPPLRPVGEVSWSPDGTLITAVYAMWTFIYLSYGIPVVEHVLDDARTVSVSWSPDSSIQAISYDNGTIAFVSRDGHAFTTLIVGDEKVLLEWSPTRNIIALASGNHLTLLDPTFLGDYARLDIRGLSFLNITIVSQDRSIEHCLPAGRLVIYLPPGEYNLTYNYSSTPYIIGDRNILAQLDGSTQVYLQAGMTVTLNITVHQGRMARLTIINPENFTAYVSISWSGGNYTTTMESQDFRVLRTLAPETYNISYILPRYTFRVLGPPKPIGESITLSLEPGDNLTVKLKEYQKLLTSLYIESLPGMKLNLSWDDEFVEVMGNNRAPYYLIPGNYTLYYQYIIYSNIVGVNERSTRMTFSLPIQAHPGEQLYVEIPPRSSHFSQINIKAPQEGGVVVLILWDRGSSVYHILAGGLFPIEALPGNYTIIYNIDPDFGHVGPKPGSLGQEIITVERGENITLKAPSYNTVFGKIVITGSPGAKVKITWRSGVAFYTIPSNGTLEVWATPGTYNVSLKDESRQVRVEKGGLVKVDFNAHGILSVLKDLFTGNPVYTILVLLLALLAFLLARRVRSKVGHEKETLPPTIRGRCTPC